MRETVNNNLPGSTPSTPITSNKTNSPLFIRPIANNAQFDDPRKKLFHSSMKDIVVQPLLDSNGGSLRIKPTQQNAAKDLKVQELKKDVLEFIEQTLEETVLPNVSLHQYLKDGIVLCKIANKLKSGVIERISLRPLPFLQMENISNFVHAAKELGVPSSDLFQTVDLFENKDMHQVVICILTLARIYGKSSGSKIAPKKKVEGVDFISSSNLESSNANDIAESAADKVLKASTASQPLNGYSQENHSKESEIKDTSSNSFNASLSSAPQLPTPLINHAQSNVKPQLSSTISLTSSGPPPLPLQKPPSVINLAAQLRQEKQLKATQNSIPSISHKTGPLSIGSFNTASGNSNVNSPILTSTQFSASSISLPHSTCSGGHAPVVVDNYQLGNCIGKGQFGSVYKALNVETGYVAAIKRIPLDSYTSKEVDELMQEVELLESLSHPNIVQYIGFIREPHHLNIVLEYAENGSLHSLLKTFGPMTERLAVNYLLQVLIGLSYLHERKVVHCDLKAANILNTKEGVAKLSDFGVSQQLNQLDQNTKAVAGTPNWMAPEIIALDGATTQSDIWSLGCTTVELLTGRPPYHDLNPMTTMFRIVEDDCPPLPEHLSADAQKFLLRCFCKDPVKRASAEELLLHPWIKNNTHRSSVGRSPSMGKLSLSASNTSAAGLNNRESTNSASDIYAPASASAQSSSENTATLSSFSSQKKSLAQQAKVPLHHLASVSETAGETPNNEQSLLKAILQEKVAAIDPLRNEDTSQLAPSIPVTASSAPVTPKMSKKKAKKDELTRKTSMFTKRPDTLDTIAHQNTPHTDSQTELNTVHNNKDKCIIS